MNENTFWEVIGSLGWGTETTDYNKIKVKLMERFTFEQIQELEAVDRQVYSRLSEAIKAYEESIGQAYDWLPVSDDGYSDLLNHIVGLGREEWEACIKDPQRVKGRADRGDYVESFSYCWPRREDYEQRTLKGFWVWIESEIVRIGRLREGVEIPVKRGQDPNETFRVLDEAFDTVIASLRILKQGDIERFLEREKYTMWATNLLRKHVRDLHYGVDNLFHDLKSHQTVSDGPVPPVSQWPEEMQKQLQERLGLDDE